LNALAADEAIIVARIKNTTLLIETLSDDVAIRPTTALKVINEQILNLKRGK
jgi:hypothetical protein